jgi:hypothetical protein
MLLEWPGKVSIAATVLSDDSDEPDESAFEVLIYSTQRAGKTFP